MRRLRLSLAAVAALTTLALPAPAHAAQNYVVTLAPALDVTCERTILDVTIRYGLAPASYHTLVGCGFSAPLSRSQVRTLLADPRVVTVTEDRLFTVPIT